MRVALHTSLAYSYFHVDLCVWFKKNVVLVFDGCIFDGRGLTITYSHRLQELTAVSDDASKERNQQLHIKFNTTPLLCRIKKMIQREVGLGYSPSSMQRRLFDDIKLFCAKNGLEPDLNNGALFPSPEVLRRICDKEVSVLRAGNEASNSNGELHEQASDDHAHCDYMCIWGLSTPYIQQVDDQHVKRMLLMGEKYICVQ